MYALWSKRRKSQSIIEEDKLSKLSQFFSVYSLSLSLPQSKRPRPGTAGMLLFLELLFKYIMNLFSLDLYFKIPLFHIQSIQYKAGFFPSKLKYLPVCTICQWICSLFSLRAAATYACEMPSMAVFFCVLPMRSPLYHRIGWLWASLRSLRPSARSASARGRRRHASRRADRQTDTLDQSNSYMYF